MNNQTNKLQADNEEFLQPSWTPTSWGRVLMMNEGGNVTRLHTVTTLKQWSIGRHVYGVQVIIVELCRANHMDPGRCLLWALYHDAEEVHTGDVPAPTKRRLGNAGRIQLELMEQQFRERWDLPKPDQHLLDQGIPRPTLSDMEYAICKAADALDLGVCMLQERQLGNRQPTARRVLDNIMDYTVVHEWVPGVKEFKQHLQKEWDYYE